jgi:hypothetical protein
MMDVLASISQLQGDSTNQSYVITDSDVRIYIIPASNEAVALYDGMPQGQSFQFKIKSDTIDNLKQASRITVTDGQVSDLTTGDKLITMTDTKRTRIGGRFYLMGLCYKEE